MKTKDTILLEQAYNQIVKRILSEQEKSEDKDGWHLDSTEKQVIQDPNAQQYAKGKTSEIENQSAKDEKGNELSYTRTQTPVVASDEEMKGYKPTAVKPTEDSSSGKSVEAQKQEQAKNVYLQAIQQKYGVDGTTAEKIYADMQKLKQQLSK